MSPWVKFNDYRTCFLVEAYFISTALTNPFIASELSASEEGRFKAFMGQSRSFGVEEALRASWPGSQVRTERASVCSQGGHPAQV